MSVEVVPVEYVHTLWPEVRALIEPAMQYSHGEHTLDHIQMYLASGEWRLLAVVSDMKMRGAIIVNMFNRPNQRVAFIQAVGGKNVVNEAVFNQMRAIVVGWGATIIECAARSSMQRLLKQIGFTDKYMVLGVEI